ncbi:MAG: hypothetical protein KDA96_02570 [Planctomycetaceae bacterium]|nr:hypothetical protein [Planctomycetaceae bacterium]
MSRQTMTLILVCCILSGISFSMRGCQRYGSVSDEAFAHAKALYAACDQRDPLRLQSCASLIALAEASRELSTAEARFLREIVAKAQADNWEVARADARRMMAEQAGRR